MGVSRARLSELVYDEYRSQQGQTQQRRKRDLLKHIALLPVDGQDTPEIFAHVKEEDALVMLEEDFDEKEPQGFTSVTAHLQTPLGFEPVDQAQATAKTTTRGQTANAEGKLPLLDMAAEWAAQCKKAAKQVAWPSEKEEDLEQELQEETESGTTEALDDTNMVYEETDDEDELAEDEVKDDDDDGDIETTKDLPKDESIEDISGLSEGSKSGEGPAAVRSYRKRARHNLGSLTFFDLPDTPYDFLKPAVNLAKAKRVWVSKGDWEGQEAVLKFIDISEDSSRCHDMARQISAMNHLSSNNVDCAPIPYAAGQCFEGLLLWVAMTPVGKCIKDLPAKQLQVLVPEARTSLAKIHAAGLLHGNPVVENICVFKGKVIFTGFSKASPCEDPQLQEEELAELNESLDELIEDAQVYGI